MNKVSKLRRYTGLTQSDVAEIFGISLQAYSRKEREITPFTDKEKLILKELFIEDFPDITVGEIFLMIKCLKLNDKERVKCRIKVYLSFKFS